MTLAAEQLGFRLRHAFDESTEDKSPQIRQLTIQWDDVVSPICLLPDFRRFLLPPLFSDLQKAAKGGPVVILNASKYSCDALFITSAQDSIYVPLGKIIRSHWQNPEFAFLSACHATVGDESSPDEAIHLAAAMQFSRFRGVIGSMWSINDGVTHQLHSTARSSNAAWTASQNSYTSAEVENSIGYIPGIMYIYILVFDEFLTPQYQPRVIDSLKTR
ncbi:uncharacterized protein BJ212DRAFT_1355719 [Suillus subaureus]|uniref:CHAT domain-containing protein n=1 Tax=Suillus subaureus TaxID=48587 RepID=A0A9P7EBB1_9AGAM|nr:uncharacterized protein BJ212DRAFT_1355719 [Suillus subaureus]KAG1815964.1 hypothetical protein BJ212DRAFT_1355719 [Suillus subaureus]